MHLCFIGWWRRDEITNRLLRLPRLDPSCPPLQPDSSHALKLTRNLLPLTRDLVGGVFTRPKSRGAEAIVEIGAEVVHGSDWEQDVP